MASQVSEAHSNKAAVQATNDDASASKLADEGQVISDSYKLLPVDLRDIPKLDEVIARANMDPRMRLIYLDSDSSRNIVSWASRTFSTSIFFLYEQILPDDAFGQQMIRNLESRGCALLSLYSTPTLHAKEMLFLDQGWQRALAWDMLKIYSQFIDSRERRRIERLELFDEWHMMQEHYCVAYAINDSMGLFEEFGFPGDKQDPHPSSATTS